MKAQAFLNYWGHTLGLPSNDYAYWLAPSNEDALPSTELNLHLVQLTFFFRATHLDTSPESAQHNTTKVLPIQTDICTASAPL